jgi:hypothetical protein
VRAEGKQRESRGRAEGEQRESRGRAVVKEVNRAKRPRWSGKTFEDRWMKVMGDSALKLAA